MSRLTPSRIPFPAPIFRFLRAWCAPDLAMCPGLAQGGVPALGRALMFFAVWFSAIWVPPVAAQAQGESLNGSVKRTVTALPAPVIEALQQAKVPAQAFSLVIQEVGSGTSVLSWRAQEPVNPASLMKLLTTYAALDTLGPTWTWATPVWIEGTVSSQGVLQGNLVIKGSGDPKMVMERVWLLLRRVQQWGVREIQGDIVIDRSAFNLPASNPADFDGEPLRPYNVTPDALMLNYKTISIHFTPDEARDIALVSMEPALAGVQVPAQVPLSPAGCDDWRAGLQADFSRPDRIALRGKFPLACGERSWPLAFPEPDTYSERLILSLWESLGGKLTGRVRDGTAPARAPSFEVQSAPLAEVVRDINKFSNNVMAQQLFLTLAQAQRGQGSPEQAREVLSEWARSKMGASAQSLVAANGSGLSRENRVSAQLLADLLQSAWSSPVMAELMSSLPISGLDGTLKRFAAAPGRAHLKTGSLKDVSGLAGYLLGPSGKRYVVVAIINHPNANAARLALELGVRWAADRP